MESIWYINARDSPRIADINMTGSIPHYSANTFPGEEPPTLFGPADKKKPAKVAMTSDKASVKSSSTFGSTMSLLKSKLSRKSEDAK